MVKIVFSCSVWDLILEERGGDDVDCASALAGETVLGAFAFRVLLVAE